jgi:hypothetical protein
LSAAAAFSNFGISFVRVVKFHNIC